jgi:hypothetical protein
LKPNTEQGESLASLWVCQTRLHDGGHVTSFGGIGHNGAPQLGPLQGKDALRAIYE